VGGLTFANVKIFKMYQFCLYKIHNINIMHTNGPKNLPINYQLAGKATCMHFWNLEHFDTNTPSPFFGLTQSKPAYLCKIKNLRGKSTMLLGKPANCWENQHVAGETRIAASNLWLGCWFRLPVQGFWN
jgi:hypothetical protein